MVACVMCVLSLWSHVCSMSSNVCFACNVCAGIMSDEVVCGRMCDVCAESVVACL